MDTIELCVLSQLKLLLDAGFAVNSRNHHCLTPLHLAAAQGRLEMVKLLVRQGADCDARTGPPCKVAVNHID